MVRPTEGPNWPSEAPKYGLTYSQTVSPSGVTSKNRPNQPSSMSEWAYGVTDWLELGAYLPLYSWTGTGNFLIEGAKLQTEFVVPHTQEWSFFYGINFELSFNALYWEPTRNSGEIRPIIGVRFGPVDMIANPIIDTSFQGFGSLDFAPAARWPTISLRDGQPRLSTMQTTAS